MAALHETTRTDGALHDIGSEYRSRHPSVRSSCLPQLGRSISHRQPLRSMPVALAMKCLQSPPTNQPLEPREPNETLAVTELVPLPAPFGRAWNVFSTLLRDLITQHTLQSAWHHGDSQNVAGLSGDLGSPSLNCGASSVVSHRAAGRLIGPFSSTTQAGEKILVGSGDRDRSDWADGAPDQETPGSEAARWQQIWLVPVRAVTTGSATESRQTDAGHG